MVRSYERLGILSVEEVLKAIAEEKPLTYLGVTCQTHSVRLLTYHIHGVNCVVPGCCISGQYFAVERALKPAHSRYHLNLYGVHEGEEVMMTSDHKIPKSKGGVNAICNRQPMCYPHNSQKGNRLIYT